jgi:hypothetical protein
LERWRWVAKRWQNTLKAGISFFSHLKAPIIELPITSASAPTYSERVKISKYLIRFVL